MLSVPTPHQVGCSVITCQRPPERADRPTFKVGSCRGHTLFFDLTIFTYERWAHSMEHQLKLCICGCY